MNKDLCTRIVGRRIHYIIYEIMQNVLEKKDMRKPSIFLYLTLKRTYVNLKILLETIT